MPLRTALRLAVVGTLTLAALSAGVVAAEDSSKLYAGVGVGLTDFESAHAGIGYGEAALGWQLYGGLQARESMAVELAVERLASVEQPDVLGSGVERLRISAEHSAMTVRGVFSLPLEEVLRRRQRITLFGTLGLSRSLEERAVLELTTSRTSSVAERDTALVVGAGVTFELARVRLRTYLQSVQAAHDLDSLGVAAEFRF
jgi:hypothetical protein